jgi:DNA repair protein RadD
MNFYSKLAISQLEDVIGQQVVTDIENIFDVLNDSEFDPGMVRTRGFLSGFVSETLGFSYLKTVDGRALLKSSLADNDLKRIYERLNNHPAPDNRDVLVSDLLGNLRRRSSARIIAEELGFSLNDSVNEVHVFRSSCERLEPASVPYKALKDYQTEVFFKARLKLETPFSRFIMQMPTGSGKTRTAIEIACEFLNESADRSVIWLAHSTELCDQAGECFLQIWPHVARHPLTFQRYYSSYRFGDDNKERIGFFVGSFQSIFAEINSLDFNSRLNPKRLIILDEAHKAIAPTYKQVTRALMLDGTNVMGLTATPGRSYSKLNSDLENEELAEFFFETNITFSGGEEDPIGLLRSRGVLAKAHFEGLVVSSGTNVDLTDRERDYVSKMFEFPASLLDRLSKDSVRNAEIVARLVQLVRTSEARKIIYFATSIAQSVLISSILKVMKVRAQHVDGTTDKFSRERIIQEFRDGELNVLCNYEVLATGFDAPKIDCVFIARPTASVVLYSQMIGRGLRGPALGGKERCLIVNVRDNISNLPSVNEMYRIFDAYWSS